MQRIFVKRYTDEYTGERLPPNLIRTAIVEELDYFNSKVWEISAVDQMAKYPDAVMVKSRWVLCNKEDADSPDVRARLVSCELNKDGRNDAFSASPPFSGQEVIVCKMRLHSDKKGCATTTFVCGHP